MSITLSKYPLNEKLSIHTELEKQYIVWHGSGARTKFTPYGKTPSKGTCIVDHWNNVKEKQGVPYVIDRGGTVFNTFDDSRWSYHLNLPTNQISYDKQSIGIVLANELNLIKENGRYFAFDYNHTTNEYFGKVVAQSFRGYDFWAKIDEAQIDALLELTMLLSEKYKIKPVFYSGNDWNPKAWESATILTHATVNQNALDFPPFEPWIIDKIKKAGIEITS